MWATLAAMAMAAKELNTAEVAFAAIDEVDKLHFVLKVKVSPWACWCTAFSCADVGRGGAAMKRGWRSFSRPSAHAGAQRGHERGHSLIN